MSLTNLQATTNPTTSLTQGTQQKSSASTSGTSFAATLANVDNGTHFTDAEVRRFFANKPDAQQIASKAASLGLNEDQIARAMEVGGYGDADTAALKKGIESFVADLGNGYAWDANGGLAAAKSTVQSATSADKAMPTAESIKAFYATHPSDDQVTAKVKGLGLNAAQMVQFQATGIGMNINQISAPVLESMFVDAANRLGTDIGGGKHGGWTSYFSPTLGRAITKSEIQTFFSSNPNQSQIFQKAADLGIGVAAVNNMMSGLGMQNDNTTYGSRFNMMDTSLYQGRDGFSLDQYGHIVAGGGNQFVASADGTSGSWVPKATNGTSTNELT